MLSFMPRAKAARAGKVYGAPGDGYSGHISLVTALVLIGAWFLVTEAGWVKPLFLPSPIAVYNKFILASTDGGFYTAQYFRAWCIEAQLKKVLKSKYGEAWFQNPQAGEFMRELWSKGQSLPGDALVKQVCGEELNAHPVMAEIASVLEKKSANVI